MTRNLTLIAGAAVLLFGPEGFAQSRGSLLGPPRPAALSRGAIEGQVLDQRGKPVKGATVSVLGASNAATLTDAQGRFQLAGLEPDEYVVRAHRLGFVPSAPHVVQVEAGVQAVPALTVRQAGQHLAAVGTAGALQIDEGGGDTTETAAEGAGDVDDDHSDLAWRLRHLKRTALRDATDRVGVTAEAGDADRDPANAGLSRAWAPGFAASLFAGSPIWGEVNLLTTGAFDGPRDLFDGAGVPRSVAYVTIGSPVGPDAEWSLMAATTQGDVASWQLAGSYQNRLSNAHSIDVGMSYSTQRYDGGNPAALAATSDGSRNVGAIYGLDHWSFSEAATISYGARYARYDYLERDTGLFSPQLGAEVLIAEGMRLRGYVSQQMLAPGAEEFLPPAMAGVWLPPERTFSPLRTGATFRPERTQHAEVALVREIAPGYAVGIRRFYQHIDDQLVTLFGVRTEGGPAVDLGHYFVGSAGNVNVQGWALTLTYDLLSRVRGNVDYALTTANWAASPEAALIALSAASAARRGVEQFHDVTTTIETDIPETATRILVLYRISNAYAQDDPREVLPALDGRFDIRVHQALPFLEFSDFKWEVLFAIRNLFRDGAIDSSLYDELLAVRPPKRVLGGVMVRF